MNNKDGASALPGTGLSPSVEPASGLAGFAASIPDAELLGARLRELSKVLCAYLGGGSEWFSRIGDDFYVDPKIIAAELQRRKSNAHATKRALVRANFMLAAAQAIEARSGETGTGSIRQDESAVPAGDAPNTDGEQPGDEK